MFYNSKKKKPQKPEPLTIEKVKELFIFTKKMGVDQRTLFILDNLAKSDPLGAKKIYKDENSPEGQFIRLNADDRVRCYQIKLMLDNKQYAKINPLISNPDVQFAIALLDLSQGNDNIHPTIYEARESCRGNFTQSIKAAIKLALQAQTPTAALYNKIPGLKDALEQIRGEFSEKPTGPNRRHSIS